MNIKKIIMLAMVICIGVSFNAAADNQTGGKRYIFNLIGSDEGYLKSVPGLADDATCFDVDLVNAKNRQVIGTATDCLSEIEGIGTGVRLIGTTFFYLPQGTLITRGYTTVQPVLQPTVTPDGTFEGQNISHITGASGLDNAIIGGTGRFADSSGTVRLSGMVHMDTSDTVTFDCLFIVDLD